METVIGNNNYVVQIDDQNNVQNVIYCPIGTTVTSNHDALNVKKMQALDEAGVINELVNPVYTLKLLNLPEYGNKCDEKIFYKYGDKIVICRQTHNRTEHAVETIPNLFTFFRIETGTLEWINNELIQVDWIRFHLGVKYKCIQPHMTVEGQTPNLTPALWVKVTVGVLPWVQPGSTNPYMKGNRVTFNGFTWESLIDNNVWSPAVYGWKKV